MSHVFGPTTHPGTQAHTYTSTHAWLKKVIITLFSYSFVRLRCALENHVSSRGKLELEKGDLKYSQELEPLWARYCIVIIRRNRDT